jgi:hypothetical protein
MPVWLTRLAIPVRLMRLAILVQVTRRWRLSLQLATTGYCQSTHGSQEATVSSR